jgi:hypothetical protein
MPSVLRFDPREAPWRPRRKSIVAEYRHALEQLALQSRYPGRPQTPDDLPQSEFGPWPSAFDNEE